jgi:hypothetical protein
MVSECTCLKTIARDIYNQKWLRALIKKVSATEMDRSYTASVVSDIQRLVAHFPSFRFRKISREDNKPAHELARMCRVECSAGVLQGAAPPYVLELALLDCNQNLSSF